MTALVLDSLIVRTSSRAKRLRLQVTHEGVELIKPQRVAPKAVQAFLDQHQSWIIKATEYQAHQCRGRAEHWPVQYRTGETFYLLGESYQLRVSWDATQQVVWGERVLTISLAPHYASYSLNKIESLFRKTLREKMQMVLSEVASRWHAKIGGVLAGVKITQARRRWGSCTGEGVIRLHQALVMAPPTVLEYVLIHELTHLHYKHHRPLFWRMVAEHCPDYIKQENWLKEHSYLLSF